MVADVPKDCPQTLLMIKQAQQGDIKALNNVFKKYTKYISVMTRIYTNVTDIDDVDDLRAYIKIGLLEGIKRFDPNRGAKFIYFAHTWMKKNIFLGEETHRIIRVPLNQRLFYNSFLRELGKDSEDMQYSMSFKDEADIRKFMTVDNTKTETFTSLSVLNEKLDIYEFPEHLIINKTLETFNESEEELSLDVLKANIEKVLSTFSDKEIYIMKHLFGLNGAELMTSEQIAEKLNVTKVNVTFTKTRVIRMLRHSSLSNQLLDGL